MLGRGLLAHPGLADQLAGETAGDSAAGEISRECTENKEKSAQRDTSSVTRERLHHYIVLLQERYTEAFSGEIPVLFKMKEIWGFLIESFQNGEKFRKKIHKCQRLSDYERIREELFYTLELKE